ncbi:MAG TPA: LPS assembly protein LptD [Steroidobacteraceae bacterium]
MSNAFLKVCLCGVLLGASALALGADMCPAPPRFDYSRPLEIAPDDHRIHIQADKGFVTLDLNAAVQGRVIVQQDDRKIGADEVFYDFVTDRINVKGKVDFIDPKLHVRSESGTYKTEGGGNFNEANFDLFDRNGRGFARKIEVRPDGKIDLAKVRYTSCPAGNEDWLLQATSLDLDTKKQEGTGHNVVMRFKSVPVFYTPYISFPLGDARKSGVLFPSFGHSGTNGWEFELPYYFNLAPNYDLTVTPGYLSARGVQLAEDFRYLTHTSRGALDATFLPDDKVEHGNRSYLRLTDITDIQHGLRFDVDAANVSDSNYFLNFAVGSEQTSVTYLERRADVFYYDDYWRIRGELQNFQTIDVNVPDLLRPYSRLPDITASGLYPIGDSGFEFALDSEAVDFVRSINPADEQRELYPGTDTALPNINPSGLRLNLAPELRYSFRTPGYFFEPAVGYDFTQYDLHDPASGLPATPTRSLPYARVDTGLVFEREAGSQGQRTQTLEPRLVYSYVPYRNQDELPVFDSGLPDLNLTELFRTNRYVGYDRIGDANQIAMALTTRLFDHDSGTQYLSATLGQIRYFDTPRVDLTNLAQTNLAAQTIMMAPPVNPLAIPGALLVGRGTSFIPYPDQPLYGGYYPGVYASSAAANAVSQPLNRASDIVAEVALTGYKHFSLNLDYQWNPYTSKTEKNEVSLQYKQDPTRVVNIGYRFQEGTGGPILKQLDGSFAWPIAGHWNTVGRWVYSLLPTEINGTLKGHQTIEQVAGFEYKSCCYRIQLVQRRYLSNRVGGLDTSIALQLELTGLSSVGKRADSFLEQSIRGYSTRDPNAQ